jgi:hypothetical protein
VVTQSELVVVIAAVVVAVAAASAAMVVVLVGVVAAGAQVALVLVCAPSLLVLMTAMVRMRARMADCVTVLKARPLYRYPQRPAYHPMQAWRPAYRSHR